MYSGEYLFQEKTKCEIFSYFWCSADRAS